VFWNWLRRGQFFTACVLILAIYTAVQSFSPTSSFYSELPSPVAVAALIAIVLVSAICVRAVESATEAFLDAIVQMPTERLDTSLITSLMKHLRGAVNSASAGTPALPKTEYYRAAESLRLLLEEMVPSLQNSVSRLADNAELLASTMRALSAREAATVITGEERVTEQLLIALHELAGAIEGLRSREEGVPTDPSVPVPKGPISQQHHSLDNDLGREVRELLKEFD
jgi:hypothetical protein